MINIENIRNFGIIAHIDAGKTTTTERILYLTKANYKIGEVDDGTTTTDWMIQEKERGITITSASVSCLWKEKILHIIDTPGHVDFTAEVIRSLRVLDGAVVVFCGVAGVQTQSETVWKLANKYSIPRIIWINKLDRVGANFERVVKEIEEKLKIKTLPLTIPYYEKDQLKGVINILEEKLITFIDDGNIKEKIDIPENYKEKFNQYKEHIINVLTSFDDKLLEKVLLEDYTKEDIIKSIRNGTINYKFSPLFAGSSFKNIGVTELLDGIAYYLPSPDDIGFCEALVVKENVRKKIYYKDTNYPILYLFKIQYNREKGALCFTRIYTGSIKSGDILYNPRTKKRERITDLLKVYADKFERIEKAEAGDIVVLIGIKESLTGDTLCNEAHQVVLESLSFPEPVVFVKVEPKNAIDMEKFLMVKEYLLLEDPTISYKEDKDTGQILIGGMGELHIEIFLDRIKREFGVELRSGQPQIIYRESPTKEAVYTYEFEKKISGNIQHVTTKLSVKPQERGQGIEIAYAINKKDYEKEIIDYIERGIKNALEAGPESAFPVVDAKITVEEIIYDKNKTNPIAIEAAVNICTSYLLREAGIILLEPIMKIEIDTPNNFTGVIIGDLQSKQAIILDIIKKEDSDVIIAKIALKEMFGYATILRSMTQGKGSFSMEFLEFDKLS